MSVLEDLEGFLSNTSLETPVKKELFNTTTPEGAFFNAVHKSGYSLVNEDGTPTELQSVLSCYGNQKIDAIAGSGKTTALVFKILHDIVTGEAMRLHHFPTGGSVPVVNKMWVCTFLRSGADELRTALNAWQTKLGYKDRSGSISFSTLDAEFNRCLKAMGVKIEIAGSTELMKMFRKAVDSLGITSPYGGNLSQEDYQILLGIVTYYRGRLDDKKYQHINSADYDLTPSTLDLLVKQFASIRQSEGLMDHDEVQELLYKYLYVNPNPKVQEFVAQRYKFIYIDEFQDTSQMQYAILKFYARGRLWMNISGVNEDNSILYTGQEIVGKIVAIGDPSQCIYSFKGADSTILVEKFDRDFRPINCTLSYNYRCPENILKPVVKSIHHNADSAHQVIKSFSDGGDFSCLQFVNIKDMASRLISSVSEDVKNGKSVAVICRTNFDGMIPAFAMESGYDIHFSISGESMTMNSPLPRKLLGVGKLFLEHGTVAVRDALEMFLPRHSKGIAKQLCDVLKTNNKRFFDLPEADIAFSARDLLGLYKTAKSFMLDDKGQITPESELRCLKYLYSWLSSEVYGGSSSYATGAREFISMLILLMESGNFTDVSGFIQEVEYMNERLKARIKRTDANVHVVTVHESKGKEYDCVYIWNDSEGVFPSSKCDTDNVELLAEERRVHYIACTRAKEKCVISTLAGKSGMFVQEMDVKMETVVLPKNLSKSVVL